MERKQGTKSYRKALNRQKGSLSRKKLIIFDVFWESIWGQVLQSYILNGGKPAKRLRKAYRVRSCFLHPWEKLVGSGLHCSTFRQYVKPIDARKKEKRTAPYGISTIFPRGLVVSRTWCASGASARAIFRPMTGSRVWFSKPAAIAAWMLARSLSGALKMSIPRMAASGRESLWGQVLFFASFSCTRWRCAKNKT